MGYIFLAMILGFIPAIIAGQKGRSCFLWWIFGSALFIIALPLAIIIKGDEEFEAKQKGLCQCPKCAEWIKKEAKICRYCNTEVKLKNYCPK